MAHNKFKYIPKMNWEDGPLPKTVDNPRGITNKQAGDELRRFVIIFVATGIAVVICVLSYISFSEAQ